MRNIFCTMFMLFSTQTFALNTSYSALVFGDFTSPHSGSNGPLAIGEDADLSGYSIFNDFSDFPNSEYSLTVGGDLTYNSGRVYRGNVIVNGDIEDVNHTVFLGMAETSTITGSADLPIDFDNLEEDIINYSTTLSKLENVGTVEALWGGLYLKGDCTSDMQVFNLDGYKLEKSHTIALSCIPENATVIVNISGDKSGFSPLSNKSLQDFLPHRSKTIFNLFEATSLKLSGVSIEGLVLAPHADVSAPSGTSNVGIIADSFEGSMFLGYQPFDGQILTSPLEADLKWHWESSAFMPEYDQVMMTPVTGQLNDDNGDGVIDNRDVADVVFVSFQGSKYSSAGVLRAVSGKDGSDLWIYNDGPVWADPRFSPAIADMDNDGIVEIIVGHREARSVYVVDNVGSIQDSIKYAGYRNIAIADINSDSNPEILLADGVYSYNNGYLYRFATWGPDPIAVDVDLDGSMEVFANASLYNQFGDIIWSDTSKHDFFWFSAVANLDSDPEPEFVTSIPGKDSSSYQLLAVYEHDGELKWQVEDQSKQGGGVQAISSFLGNNELGIVSASMDKVSMYDTNGNLVWSYTIDDISSYKVGVSAYDFDADGRDEVVVQDQFQIAVLDGKTGQERLVIENSSATLYEYPIVVDLEGDNNAELIVVSNNFDPRYNTHSGVRAFESEDGDWKNATRIWNQHSYHQTNITQDGKIPQYEMPSWLLNNTYRSSTLR
ncbi:choice-of-anchor A family protein [Grimontia sp. NTOU-MAR1]|uniref:choice-of-anchor A family protein n=1 Tax=Grimontia sp. NTOU-MAR1 TaxID=3111011 RepID=UPI002DB76073|nr:choice-of-anchor A family protein [Grimontia sp. NTOU-MAR1]WRV97589.1 choice-of-anchor A family protein [Grimontia sp. NTOU-MAR1]